MCSSAGLAEYGSAASTSRWVGVGSASIASAWSGWVAMTTASNVVGVAVAVDDLDAVRRSRATDVTWCRADVVEPRADPVDVRARAADHRLPLRRPEDAEHAVVVEEGEQVAGGVVQRDLRVARPDRGHDGLHEVAGEVRREAAGVEELAQRRSSSAVARPASARGRARWKRGISASIRRYAGRARLRRGREQAGGAERAGPLQAGRVVADGHRHLGVLGGDAELGEHPQQGRVGPLVVHDEAGVDGQHAVGAGDVVGVGVAAEPVVGLEEGDVRRRRCDATYAAVSPATPEPTTATAVVACAVIAQAASKSNRATGARWAGRSRPPARR